MRRENHVNLCKAEVYFPFLNGLLRLGENIFLCYIGVYIEAICIIRYIALTFVGHVKVFTGVCRHHLNFIQICEGENVDCSHFIGEKTEAQKVYVMCKTPK